MDGEQEAQNKNILDFAMQNFSRSTHEYGRGDMAGRSANKQGEKIDGSRFNEDFDHDGRKGVDCSSLVYYSLVGAGFDVKKNASEFTTTTLFSGNTTTEYARSHFEILPATSKTDQSLKEGDLLMLKMPSGSQHVAIFKGYDEQGQIQFFGSQTSTGPAVVTLTGNAYWDTQTTFYGALRPKEDFIKPELRHGGEAHSTAVTDGNTQEIAAKQSRVNELNSRAVLIASAESHTHRLFKEAGLDFANGGANTVASVTLLAAKHNITEIEHISVKDGQINIAQKDPSGFGYNTASIDAVQAANTDKELSLQALKELDGVNNQNPHVEQQVIEQAHLDSIKSPKMG